MANFFHQNSSMASPSSSLKLLFSLSSPLNHRFHPPLFLSLPPPPYSETQSYPSQHKSLKLSSNSNPNSFRIFYRFSASKDDDDEDEEEAENCTFDEAVELFNRREYYKCHDYLEGLWNRAEEPSRTLIHGILQCSVGFHHLFNQVYL